MSYRKLNSVWKKLAFSGLAVGGGAVIWTYVSPYKNRVSWSVEFFSPVFWEVGQYPCGWDFQVCYVTIVTKKIRTAILPLIKWTQIMTKVNNNFAHLGLFQLLWKISTEPLYILGFIFVFFVFFLKVLILNVCCWTERKIAIFKWELWRNIRFKISSRKPVRSAELLWSLKQWTLNCCNVLKSSV